MAVKPPEENLDADVAELLRVMPQALRRLKRRADAEISPELREAAAEASLGPRHFPLLMALAHAERLTVSELADRVGLALATTSLMVGELERAGLVVRGEDAEDRRRHLVTLTPGRREAIMGFAEMRARALREALGRMEPAVRAGFIAGWRVLAAGDDEA